MYDGALSSSVKLESGIQQGSLLSGACWTVYIDDLLKELCELNMGCDNPSSSSCAAFRRKRSLPAGTPLS